MQQTIKNAPVLAAMIASLAAAVLALPAKAQGSMFERIAPPPSPAPQVPLYTSPLAVAPGALPEVWDRMMGNPVLRNITQPTLTPVLPTPGKATGAAVIVLPGGGFTMLAMDSEGWTIARWLADRGIAAFVLKYRTAQTPADETVLLGNLAKSMAGLMTDPENTMAPLAPPAVADGLAALKLVRANATKWHIDPARVGMIGFSAGAMATRDGVLSADPASRPAFFGYIYGPMRDVTVPADAPPMFAGLALDDPLFGKQGFGIVNAWRKVGRPVELHAYEQGGHGFGAGKPGTTTTMLLPEFHAWLAARGLLRKP